ncbi:hypothetical protein GGH95_001830 [Coemansia sp. RSA 1836]|nr:hypothetical protein GGF38_000367 [Coemansia sp. RSA 25]KAJ2507366.1 hypothetical protein IWW47_001139 [Coemansia sp. RSA 2052]KAJ2581906.1 hypothetical protein GGH95_001830 [Coemansia sp. RSA 1836]
MHFEILCSAFVATPKRLSVEEPQSVVAERARKNRPVSPHLSIYQPQMSWVLSGMHRNTGVLIGGAAYMYAALFGLAPAFGLDLSSAAMAGSIAALPAVVTIGAKALLSSCLSFHVFGTMRHLWWDTGRSVSNKGVITTGYAALAATALATGYLTFF